MKLNQKIDKYLNEGNKNFQKEVTQLQKQADELMEFSKLLKNKKFYKKDNSKVDVGLLSDLTVGSSNISDALAEILEMSSDNFKGKRPKKPEINRETAQRDIEFLKSFKKGQKKNSKILEDEYDIEEIVDDVDIDEMIEILQNIKSML